MGSVKAMPFRAPTTPPRRQSSAASSAALDFEYDEDDSEFALAEETQPAEEAFEPEEAPAAEEVFVTEADEH